MAEEQKRELEETKEFLDLWIKGAGRAQRTYNQELKKKEEEIRDLKSKLERADWSTRRRPRRKTDRGHQATVGREKSIPKVTSLVSPASSHLLVLTGMNFRAGDSRRSSWRINNKTHAGGNWCHCSTAKNPFRGA